MNLKLIYTLFTGENSKEGIFSAPCVVHVVTLVVRLAVHVATVIREWEKNQ